MWRSGPEVTAVRLGGGRVNGVVLDNGDEIPSRAVSSSLDPRQTFLRMVGPDDRREAFGRNVIDTIAEYAPDLPIFLS